MCTVLVDIRPEDAWPVVIGGNRDEQRGRPWKAPDRHWPDRPEVVGGLDELAGGSWLGVNDWGVFACLLNRYGTLGPAPDKRSRGELVLDALDHADAADAAEALADIDPLAYRPFNLLVIDNRDAYWIRHTDDENGLPPELHPIPPGLSMFTAHDRNDLSDPRIRTYLPRAEAAQRPTPDIARPDYGWRDWEALLASRTYDLDKGPTSAMCFATPSGFGTSSSALVALPSIGARQTDESPTPTVFRFQRTTVDPDTQQFGPQASAWQTVLPDGEPAP